MADRSLARFEDWVKRFMEDSVARLLGRRVQPVEIAKALGRAMEDRRIISAGAILVPNDYYVKLSIDDFANLAAYHTALQRELVTYLINLANERGYTLLSRPKVILSEHSQITSGVRVVAQMREATESQPRKIDATQEITMEMPRLPQEQEIVPRLIFNGREIEMVKNTLTIGRNLDNDVIINDARVSRRHAQIAKRYGKYVFTDLHSANGSWINGEATQECTLENGDVISAGGVEMIFKT